MKKNFKRWLALMLAVVMVVTTCMTHTDGFLRATDGAEPDTVQTVTVPADPAVNDTTDGEGAVPPEAQGETNPQSTEPTQEVQELVIPKQDPAAVPAEGETTGAETASAEATTPVANEGAAEATADNVANENTADANAADGTTPADGNATEAVAPAEKTEGQEVEVVPSEKKENIYNVVFHKPAVDGGKLYVWEEGKAKEEASYKKGKFVKEVKEGTTLCFEIKSGDNFKVEKVTDKSGQEIKPEKETKKSSVYKIVVEEEKEITILYKEEKGKEEPKTEEPKKEEDRLLTEKFGTGSDRAKEVGPKEMTVYLENTVTVVGSEGQSHNWTIREKTGYSILSGKKAKDLQVVFNNKGDYTLTHSWKNGSETFLVHVIDFDYPPYITGQLTGVNNLISHQGPDDCKTYPEVYGNRDKHYVNISYSNDENVITYVRCDYYNGETPEKSYFKATFVDTTKEHNPAECSVEEGTYPKSEDIPNWGSGYWSAKKDGTEKIDDLTTYNIDGGADGLQGPATYYWHAKPTQKYTITTKAHTNCTITNTITDIPEGESRTVEYTAMPGNEIAAVVVDGKPVKLEEHKSSYTFTNIQSNHKIEVTAKPVAFDKDVYPVYYYTLLPGKDLASTGGADSIWNGMGVGSVTGVNAPKTYASGTIIEGGNHTLPNNLEKKFPDIVDPKDGKTYRYVEKGSPEADQKGTYTIEWIRTVVSSGANAGNNKFNPTVDYGTPTFHRDGQVFLNSVDYHTVTFYIQEPGESSFTIQDKYSDRKANGTSESTLARPETPDKEKDNRYWKFDGWYKNEACTEPANFDGTITQNVNYYGKYILDEDTLRYDGNGATGGNVESTIGRKNAKVKVVENGFQKTGYKFVGWNTAADGKGTSYKAGEKYTLTDADDVLYAQWEPNTDTAYTVEYYYQNDDGTYPKSTKLKENRTGTTDISVAVTEKDKVATKDGYVFDANAANVLEGTVAGDGTLVLKVYFKKQFTVTYLPGTQGTFDTQTTKSLDYGAPTPAAPEATGKAGYTFAGWEPTVEETVTKDAMYTAQWTANADTAYTVEYYYQKNGTYPETTEVKVGRTGTTDTLVTVTEDDKVATKGYAFDANAANVLEGTVAGDGSLVLKVYFKEQFTVTYLPGDQGTFDAQTTGSLDYGALTPVAPEPTGNDGYIFAGWKPVVADTVKENATYTAQWEKDANKDGVADKYQVTVTFKAVKGTFIENKKTEVKKVITLVDEKGQFSEEGSYTIKDHEMPKAKPDATYTGVGKWDKEERTITKKGPFEYTITFDQRQTSDITVNVHYEGAEKAETSKATEIVGTTYRKEFAETTTYNKKNYMLEKVEPGNEIKVEEDASKNVIDAYYVLDEDKDGKPDKYQVKITYEVINGIWIKGEGTTFTQDYLIGEQKDGKWQPKEVFLDNIPVSKPNVGYDEASGSWLDERVPTGETKVTEDATYKYKYADLVKLTATVKYVDEDTQEEIESSEPVQVSYGTTLEAGKFVKDIPGYVVTDATDKKEIKKAEQYVTVYYAKDTEGGETPIDPEEPEIKPDGKPDKYQVKITYEVINGTWIKGEGTILTQDYLIGEQKDGKWQPKEVFLDNIPVSKPNVGYDEASGSWLDEKVPTGETKVTDDATYKYKYADLVKLTATVKYVDEDTQEEIESSEPVQVSYGTTLEAGKFVKDIPGYVVTDATESVVVKEADKIVTVYYAKDTEGGETPIDPEKPEIKPDGKPDKYQVKITYEVINGTWINGEGTTFTQDYLIGEQKDGKWQPKEVFLDNIPVSKPNVGYDETTGSWLDKKVPTEETKVTDDDTYTYKYNADFSNISAKGIDKKYDDKKSVINVTGVIEGLDTVEFYEEINGVQEKIENSFVDVTKPARNIIVKVTRGDEAVTTSVSVNIAPRPITIKANDATKPFDGEKLTADGTTVTEGELVKGHSYVANVTGSQLYVGTSDNVIDPKSVVITKNDGVARGAENRDVTANYAITLQNGTLTVTDGTPEQPVDPNKVITKTHDTEKKYALGDSIFFTITATNIYKEAKTMTFEEQDNVEIVGQSRFENVEPGKTVSTIAKYVVTEEDIKAGKFTNIVKVHFEGGKSFENTDIVEELDDKNSELSVSKTTTSKPGNGETYNLGETIEYKIVVKNTGNITIENIEVKDILNAKENGGVVTELGTIESLAPNASYEMTFTHTVTEEDVLRGEIVNDAVASGNSTDPDKKDPVTEEGKVTTPVTKSAPSLYVEKTFFKTESGTKYALNDSGEFTIKVINNGNITVTDILVTDELTENVGENAFSIPSLKPGESVEFKTNKYTVSEADILKGSIKNTAIAKGKAADSKKTDVEGKGTVVVPTVEKYGHLTVTKTSTSKLNKDEKYDLGDTITYEITVKNDGNLTVKDVRVKDTIKTSSGKVTWANGIDVDENNQAKIDKIAPGEQVTLTCAYIVSEKDILNGKVENEATAIGKGSDDKNPEVEIGSETDPTVEKHAYYYVTKKLSNGKKDGAFKVGEKAEFDVFVKNIGNVTLTNIKVTEGLEKAIFIDGEGYQVIDNGKAAEIKNLKPNKSITLKAVYEITQEDVDNGGVTNNVTVEGKGPEEQPAEPDPEKPSKPTEEIPTEAHNPKFEATKVLTNKGTGEDGKFKLGETAKFDITVMNTGNVTLTNVKVTENLKGAKIVSGEGYKVVDGIAVIDEIKVGKSVVVKAEYVITQKDVDNGGARNSVTVTGNGPVDPEGKPDPENPDPTPVDPGTEIPTEKHDPKFEADKVLVNEGTGESGNFQVGDTAKFEIKVKNTGNVTLTNIKVTEQLEGAKVVSGEGYKVVDGIAVIDEIKVGDTAVVNAEYVITQADVDNNGVTNKVKVEGNGPVDPEGKPDPENPDPKPVDPEEPIPTEKQEPEFESAKTLSNKGTAENGKFKVGDTAKFDITVKNTGNVTLKDITVKEDLEGATIVKGEGYKVNWNGTATIDELAVGATVVVKAEYVITQADVDKGGAYNSVTVEGEGPGGEKPEKPNPDKPDPDPENPNPNPDPEKPGTEIPTEDKDPKMTVVKTVTSSPREDGEYRIGDRITYQITVTNSGNVTLNNVVVTDTLNATGQVTWDRGIETNSKNEALIDAIAPGETVTLGCSYVVVAADEGRDLVNTAVGDSDETTPTAPSTTDPTEVEEYYNLTINYVYADGTTAAPSVRARYLEGETFGYTSPTINGYTPNYAFVRSDANGMPARNVVFTVVYTAIPAAPAATPSDGNPGGGNAPTDNEPVGAELRATEDDMEVVPVVEEKVPLAKRDLDDHHCCMLHFLIMLIALIVYAAYTRSMKKRQERIAELADELEMELLKRKQDEVKENVGE